MKYDILTFGRASMDVYSKNIGLPFKDIKEFTASIGGSPVNIAVGTQRLGLKSALFSAVGPDPVGDFIINKLKTENVNIDFVKVIDGTTSTAVLCGIEPPDTFPLVFYRDNAPDKKITIQHVNNIDFSNFKSFLMTGTALAVEPARSAAFYATEKAKEKNVSILLDADFRAISWHDPIAYGIVLRQYMKYCDVLMATEEEILAMFVSSSDQISIKNSSISSPNITGNLKEAIKKIMLTGIKKLILKRGEKGASIYYKNGEVEDVPGFKVKVENVLGAGDSFAAGFVYGYLAGWDTYKTVRLGNACGAWLVTKQGCCNYAPTMKQITEFMEKKE